MSSFRLAVPAAVLANYTRQGLGRNSRYECHVQMCHTNRFWIRNKFANAQISVIQFVTSLERLWAEYAVCAFPAVDLQKNVHKNSAAKYHHKKNTEKIWKV